MFSVLLQENYDVSFIEERRDDNFFLIKKRIKRLGLFRVTGQILFLILSRFQKKSVATQLRCSDIESELVSKVETVIPLDIFTNINSQEALDAIMELSPDCIILSGTRILSVDFLAQINCPIINIHVGITPAYRGVHGGYWALVNQQSELFGSTIHIVDKGIDTGTILAHAIIVPSSVDTFSTYPLLQMSAALKILPSILKSIGGDRLDGFIPNLPSAIWSHPTIWQYLANRFKYNLK